MTQINELQNNDLEQPFAKRMIWNNKLQKMILSYQARQLAKLRKKSIWNNNLQKKNDPRKQSTKNDPVQHFVIILPEGDIWPLFCIVGSFLS